MKTTTIFTALSALALFVSGCDWGSVGGPTGTVTSGSGLACTTTSVCFLYPASYTQDSVDSLCSSQGGTESSGCSTSDLLGTCSNYDNANGVITYFYTSPTYSSQSVASGVCVGEGGTFAPQ